MILVERLASSTGIRSGSSKASGRVDFHSKDTENAKAESRLQQRTVIDEARETKTGLEIVRDSEHETESEREFLVDTLNVIESESENDQNIRNSQQVLWCYRQEVGKVSV